MRDRGETVLTVFEAAEIIRMAFGKEGWRWKVRSRYTAAQVVAALWVAQRESGKTSSDRLRRPPSPEGEGIRLGDLIRWARRML